MQNWFSEHWLLVAGFSVGTFLMGLATAVFVAVRLPPDYFVNPPQRQHDAGLARKILKNVAGAVLALLGVVMALPLVPGPGVILILLGLSMMDFPGKRKLEVKLLRLPGLLTQLNRIREKYGHPPLTLPEKKPPEHPEPAAAR